MIAHRLTTLEDRDRLLETEEGHIVKLRTILPYLPREACSCVEPVISLESEPNV
jgi:hypothetical protein